MPARDEASAVEHEVRIAASRETVFAYLTDPAKLVRWMGTEATLDPRPGGVCRIVVESAAVMLGEYVEVVPHHRVVITWGWESRMLAVPPASTLVEISLTPDDGGTRMRLIHRKLPAEAREFHRLGWEHFLARLASVASGGDPVAGQSSRS